MSAEVIKPYDPTAAKTAQIEEMFDNVAPTYDLLNHVLSLGIDITWRKFAIRQLAADAPKTVLDIATGTGDVAIECYKQLKPDKIIGFDLSGQMLHFGREKIAKAGLSDRIEMVQGDCEAMPFAENSFDAITVAYGVRNFETLQKGLREMYRVLRNGKKLVVIEFSKPKNWLLKQLFNTYFRYILPTIGRITSKDARAYSYLYESVQAFPDGNDFLAELEKAGFTNTKWYPLTFGICSVYIAEK